jgi:hypothetical protein
MLTQGQAIFDDKTAPGVFYINVNQEPVSDG